MAVAVDAVAADVTSNSVTSKTLSFTVGSGANRGAVAALTLQHSASAPALHWDAVGTNQALSPIGSISDTGSIATIYLFSLVAPTSGAKVLTATWTGTSDVTLAMISFTGVNQTGGSTSFAHFQGTASSGAASVAVTSATGDWALGAWYGNGTVGALSATQWYLDNAPNNFSSGASQVTGSATVTFTGTVPAPWAFAGVDVVAASGGAFTGTVSDTAASSDATTAVLNSAASLTDTAASSDATSGAMKAAGSVADSASSADAPSGTMKATGSVADTAASADVTTGTPSGSVSVSIADTAASSDASTGTMAAVAALADTNTTFAGASLLVDFTAGFLPAEVLFSRSGSGTYFDVTGTMQTAGANVPRFDFDPVTHEPLGILLENNGTNVLLNSATLSTQSVTVTAQPYALSFYGTGSVTLSGTSTGTLTGTGAFPSRAMVSFTPTAGALTLTVSGSVQFAQLEAIPTGLAGQVASSYIPTTGAAATRGVDLCTVPVGSWLNTTAGTLYAEWSYLSGGGFSNIWGLYGSNVNSDFIQTAVSQPGITNSLGSGIAVASVNEGNCGLSGTTTVATKLRTMVAYDSVGNTQTLAQNGTASGSSTASALPVIANGLVFGQAHFQNSLWGHVTRVAYFPTALSSGLLAQYSSAGLLDLAATASASISDSLASSESVSGSFRVAAALSDTAASSDALSPAATASGSLSDSASSADSTTAGFKPAGAIADTAASIDALAAGAGGTLADTAAASDATSGTVGASGSIADTAAATESLTASLTAAASLNDAASSSDATSSTMRATGSIADAASATDSTTGITPGRFSANLADTVAASESLSAVLTATGHIADGAVASDSLAGAAILAGLLADMVASSDAIGSSAQFPVALADAVAASDAFTARLPIVAGDVRQWLVMQESVRTVALDLSRRSVRLAVSTRQLPLNRTG